MHGAELFSLKNKHLALQKSFRGIGPNDEQLFEVKGKFSIGSSKSEVHFTNASNNLPVVLHVKGDWFDRSANITFNDQPVAHVSRSFVNVREVFGDKQTYFVTVAPGVDLTLIAAICVCLDERENEK